MPNRSRMLLLGSLLLRALLFWRLPRCGSGLAGSLHCGLAALRICAGTGCNLGLEGRSLEGCLLGSGCLPRQAMLFQLHPRQAGKGLSDGVRFASGLRCCEHVQEQGEREFRRSPPADAAHAEDAQEEAAAQEKQRGAAKTHCEDTHKLALGLPLQGAGAVQDRLHGGIAAQRIEDEEGEDLQGHSCRHRKEAVAEGRRHRGRQHGRGRRSRRPRRRSARQTHVDCRQRQHEADHRRDDRLHVVHGARSLQSVFIDRVLRSVEVGMVLRVAIHGSLHRQPRLCLREAREQELGGVSGDQEGCKERSRSEERLTPRYGQAAHGDLDLEGAHKDAANPGDQGEVEARRGGTAEGVDASSGGVLAQKEADVECCVSGRILDGTVVAMVCHEDEADLHDTRERAVEHRLQGRHEQRAWAPCEVIQQRQGAHQRGQGRHALHICERREEGAIIVEAEGVTGGTHSVDAEGEAHDERGTEQLQA
mmetsp:Transcript_67007/g.143314  ORF Transcript_67007/g.143314 Transcript_67007/m.143314 type:complete len:478 (+) Transcript_67007:51-1484(+)